MPTIRNIPGPYRFYFYSSAKLDYANIGSGRSLSLATTAFPREN
jgi:hypothetical protein